MDIEQEIEQPEPQWADHEARLAGIGYVHQLPPDVLARQREEEERYERRAQEERAQNIRSQAIHAALMLDYRTSDKDAASVLAAAREIEAFLAGA